MTVNDIIEQIEHTLGEKQPHQYIVALINDALNDMSGKIRHVKKTKLMSLTADKRWYDLDEDMIDVFKVEVTDDDGDYIMIPKITNPDHLLKGDIV